jgi:glycosyltransferase involved in cell wall biosynthesis
MERQPLVTIITIFLNAELFLEEAIASVRAQLYSNWEYLLVDDGSSDASSGIARRFANQHPGRVRYLEHPGHENRGMAASRNRGIRDARGEYVAFLDADDVWSPEKLKEQVAVLAANPRAAMVYGRAEIWHSWTGTGEKRDYFLDLGLPTDTLIEPPLLLFMLLANTAQSPMPSSFLVKRDVIEALGGFEERFRGIFEDHAFLTKLGLAFPVFVSSRCWLRYRQHTASCCAKAEVSDEARRERLALLRWMKQYFQEKGIRDGRLYWALYRELVWCKHPRSLKLARRLLRVKNRIVRRWGATRSRSDLKRLNKQEMRKNIAHVDPSN